MSKFEWRGFTPTPGEKHAGIAEVKVHGDTPFIMRFKIVSRKDGSSYFPNVASYKMPNRMPGEEYDECFMLDSRSDHDASVKFVMHHFNEWQKAQQPSVFNTNNQGHQAPQQSVPFIQRTEYQQSYSPMPDMPPPSMEEPNLPFLGVDKLNERQQR